MKKLLLVIVIILGVALVGILIYLVANGGFHSSKSFTFNVTTGDMIKITLDTSNGFDIDANLPFTISKDGNSLSQGTFITENGYQQYINTVNNNREAKILDKGTRDDIEYTFYTLYNSSEAKNEYNYIIKVKNSKTGLLLGSLVSEESAKEVFRNLTFKVE